MIRSALFLLPLLAIGCATPTSGTYEIVVDSEETDCETAEDTGDDGSDETATLEIEVSEEGDKVTLSGTLECPLDGTTFTCSSEDVIDYNEMGAGDAVMTITSDMSGTWTSNSVISGSSAAAIACEGADCETLNIQSCSGSSEWTGTLQE